MKCMGRIKLHSSWEPGPFMLWGKSTEHCITMQSTEEKRFSKYNQQTQQQKLEFLNLWGKHFWVDFKLQNVIFYCILNSMFFNVELFECWSTSVSQKSQLVLALHTTSSNLGECVGEITHHAFWQSFKMCLDVASVDWSLLGFLCCCFL